MNSAQFNKKSCCCLVSLLNNATRCVAAVTLANKIDNDAPVCFFKKYFIYKYKNN